MKLKFLIFILLIITLSATSQVKMSKSEGGLLFTENNKNVLFYQIDQKSKDGLFTRSNYIHPLWGINGTEITEDFPADHLYHRGIFWSWQQIWHGNQRIGNGWELKDFEQDVVEVEFRAGKNGAAILQTEVLWKSEKYKRLSQKIPYLKENSTITIHPVDKNYRIIDFEIRFVALEDSIKIGGSEEEKGFGGFSVRMLLSDDVTFSGPEGKIILPDKQVESNGYVIISGTTVGKKGQGGIVIVDKSDNPGYPQKWILHSRNGMQNAVFPDEKAIPVSKIDPIVLKYSLIVYSGKLTSKKIQKIIK
jgi:hypothetical protein